jgi:hypothetical protein
MRASGPQSTAILGRYGADWGENARNPALPNIEQERLKQSKFDLMITDYEMWDKGRQHRGQRNRAKIVG